MTNDYLRVIIRQANATGNRRLLEPIGNIPPAEAEAKNYAGLEDPALAA